VATRVRQTQRGPPGVLGNQVFQRSDEGGLEQDSGREGGENCLALWFMLNEEMKENI
jgi:hypothetical protein